MTPYEQFREKLRQTPRNWRLEKEFRGTPSIRISHGEHELDRCPLTEVAGVDGVGKFNKAAEKLGIEFDFARVIARAADADSFGYDSIIRADLLADCGLEESNDGQ